MGISINIKNASGRATCKICYKIIEKGENNQCEITGSALQQSTVYNYHRECIKDLIINWEKIMIANEINGVKII